MAKRMMVDFKHVGYPQFIPEEEEGAAKPCAVGIEWVNPYSLQTIRKRRVRRTDPWGRPVGPRQRGADGDDEA